MLINLHQPSVFKQQFVSWTLSFSSSSMVLSFRDHFVTLSAPIYRSSSKIGNTTKVAWKCNNYFKRIITVPLLSSTVMPDIRGMQSQDTMCSLKLMYYTELGNDLWSDKQIMWQFVLPLFCVWWAPASWLFCTLVLPYRKKIHCLTWHEHTYIDFRWQIEVGKNINKSSYTVLIRRIRYVDSGIVSLWSLKIKGSLMKAKIQENL